MIRSNTTELFDPAWAPDGQRLAFWGQVPPFFTPGIATMRIDQSDLRLVIPGGREPSYSPDGTRLAYERDGDIYVADAADGASVHTLTTTPNLVEASPAWSPNGNLIAFARQEKTHDGLFGSAIVTIHPNGSELASSSPRGTARAGRRGARPSHCRRSNVRAAGSASHHGVDAGASPRAIEPAQGFKRLSTDQARLGRKTILLLTRCGSASC